MSAEDASLQFPLHVSTEDEEFVIEKDSDDVTSPHGPQFDGTYICYILRIILRCLKNFSFNCKTECYYSDSALVHSSCSKIE